MCIAVRLYAVSLPGCCLYFAVSAGRCVSIGDWRLGRLQREKNTIPPACHLWRLVGAGLHPVRHPVALIVRQILEHSARSAHPTALHRFRRSAAQPPRCIVIAVAVVAANSPCVPSVDSRLAVSLHDLVSYLALACPD